MPNNGHTPILFRMIVFNTSELIRAFYVPVAMTFQTSAVPEPRTGLLLTFGTLAATSLFATRLICFVKSVVRVQVPFRRWTTLNSVHTRPFSRTFDVPCILTSEFVVSHSLIGTTRRRRKTNCCGRSAVTKTRFWGELEPCKPRK